MGYLSSLIVAGKVRPIFVHSVDREGGIVQGVNPVRKDGALNPVLSESEKESDYIHARPQRDGAF
jgi:hypothetical protein